MLKERDILEKNMKRSGIIFSLIALGFLHLKPQIVLGADPYVPHPRVMNVSPLAVHPGDTITLTGEEFAREGKRVGCTKTDKTIGDCTWKSIVAAYKAPRTHADYSGSRPDFNLEIISLSTSTILAKIPATIPTGDGTYNLGYFLEFNAADVGLSQANQLVGLARYDPITVSGAAPPASAAKPEYTPSPFPKQSESPTPTATESPAKKETPRGTTADTSPVPLPEQPESVNSIEKSLPSFIRSLLTFIKSIFMPGR